MMLHWKVFYGRGNVLYVCQSIRISVFYVFKYNTFEKYFQCLFP